MKQYKRIAFSTSFFLAFLGFLLLLPQGLFAQKKNYEEGLYTRIQIGAGLSLLELGAGSDVIEQRPSTFEAVSPFTGIYMGTPIITNWIVHGGISRIHALYAKDKNDTYSFNSYSLTSFSIGLSHYIMPSNFYFSLEYRLFGRIKHTKKQNENMKLIKLEQDFDSGKGFGISLGKEWQTGNGWGLGLSFLFFYDTAKGDRSRFTSFNPKAAQGSENLDEARNRYFGLVLSASYN